MSVVRRLPLAAVLAALLSSPALAQATLDIVGPYGNALGCKVAKGEEKPSEDALVLWPDRFEAAERTCDFVQVLPAKGGIKVITALCEIGDEGDLGVSLFSLTPGKTDPTTLTIRDEYGAPWDEVKPCADVPPASP